MAKHTPPHTPLDSEVKALTPSGRRRGDLWGVARLRGGPEGGASLLGASEEEDTERRQLPAMQEKGPHQKLHLLAP